MLDKSTFLVSAALLLSILFHTGVFAKDLGETEKKSHFSLESRGTNVDGSVPLYKNPNADIEDRVNDLLPRMTLEEKVSQMYVH